MKKAFISVAALITLITTTYAKPELLNIDWNHFKGVRGTVIGILYPYNSGVIIPSYNRKGLVESVYFNNDSICSYVCYRYNRKGRLLEVFETGEMKHSNCPNSFIVPASMSQKQKQFAPEALRHVYHWNNSLSAEIRTYNSSGTLVGRTIQNYGSDGQINEELQYSNHEHFNQIALYKYYPGRTEIITSDENGKQFLTQEINYNDHHDPSTVLTTDSKGGRNQINYIYTYDSYGNWIQRIDCAEDGSNGHGIQLSLRYY